MNSIYYGQTFLPEIMKHIKTNIMNICKVLSIGLGSAQWTCKNQNDVISPSETWLNSKHAVQRDLFRLKYAVFSAETDQKRINVV